MKYTKNFSTKQTAQLEPIPGRETEMAENNAGGHVFGIDCWKQLDRFLILGTEGNTYYCTEKEMTVKNANNVIKCIKENGIKAVERIVEISLTGRAPKNDPAIFALALACTFGDTKTKARAYDEIKAVCRIGTHIFQFCQDIQDLRGWSRGLRTGVGRFYTDKTNDDIAYQIVKYQQRNGWTHRDVMRLAHPKLLNLFLARYAVGKENIAPKELPKIIQGFEDIKTLDKDDSKLACKLITEYNLPRECVPTELLNHKEVWAALLENMPMTAMIRNLAKMTSVGLLTSAYGDSVKKVCANLLDVEKLKKARVHPIAILIAAKIYSQGHGMKGSLEWKPIMKIVEALDQAFYLAFDAIEPTNKNYLLGIDISGSMYCGNVAGSPLTPREAAAAMAMVTYRTEPNTEIIVFDTITSKFDITTKDTINSVINKMALLRMGRTDCAQPMLHAIANKYPVDVFCVYTDNETWAGEIQPTQALSMFRKVMDKPNAKSIVVGMTATEFSIADPKDPGMLDVCGFDTAVPTIISEFVR